MPIRDVLGAVPSYLRSLGICAPILLSRKIGKKYIQMCKSRLLGIGAEDSCRSIRNLA